MKATRDSYSAAHYRPDIDGLRAVAVTAVVLYHVGIPGVSGGFIGVDVFFVISGYLITQQLVASSDRPFTSVCLDFYARRCRRILPALALMTLVTLILSRFFLLADGEQQDLAKSSIASALFYSNVFFWQRANDYFAGPSHLQPMLHTWSLSVEEQFYLIWPLFLFALMALAWVFTVSARKTLAIGVLVLLIISFAISVVWTTTSPIAAFFMTPSRGWQLGTGALLAVTLQSRKYPAFGDGLAALGLLCIVIAVALYSSHTPYPGVAAILPTAGAAAIIGAGALSGCGFVYRLLSIAPAVETGKISYSWYLWHWPLLGLARAADLGRFNLPRDAALAAVAYGLAYLSTHWIEMPIRQKRFHPFSAPKSAIASGVTLTAVCVASSLGLWTFAHADFQTHYASLFPASVACLDLNENAKQPAGGPCLLSKGNGAAVTFYLIGDSEADHWSPAIAAWAQAHKVRAVERAFSGCNVLLAYSDTGHKKHYALRKPDQCGAFSKKVIEEIRTAAADGATVGVIASTRWGNNMNENSNPGDRRSMETDLGDALDLLTRMHVRVVLIGATPEFDYPVPACIARRQAISCRLARSQYDQQVAPADAILRAVTATSPDIRYWSPGSHFCGPLWCSPTSEGRVWYSDENHLSRVGAESAEPELAPYLSWLTHLPKANSDLSTN